MSERPVLRRKWHPLSRKFRLVVQWDNAPSKRDLQCLAVFGSMTSNNHTQLQRKGRIVMLTLRNVSFVHVENVWREQEQRAATAVRLRREKGAGAPWRS